jgi:carbon storage regulator CsrA
LPADILCSYYYSGCRLGLFADNHATVSDSGSLYGCLFIWVCIIYPCSTSKGDKMLKMTWKIGETIILDDGIQITVTEVQGDHVKIGIDEPKEVNVFREELSERMSD